MVISCLLVLLGFLGAHILYDLIKQTNSTIYCLIRGTSYEHSASRLKQRLQCYFNNELDSLFGSRIQVLQGDFTLPNLGLDESCYQSLLLKIKNVINSAAIVKHIGKENVFHNINVVGVENLMAFCKKAIDCSLVHISTLSIASYSSTQNNMLTERDLYVGQDITNSTIYIKTKFEAEKLILENIEKGLNATIFRLGNITWRLADGKYQFNDYENLFYNIIKMIIDTKMVPISLQDFRFNISPVDFCSKSIVSILKKNNKYNIYHIFNDNTLSMKDIVTILNTIYHDIQFVDDAIYQEKFHEFMEQKSIYSLIYRYFNVEKDKYDTLVDFQDTKSILDSISFHWPTIDVHYFNLILGGSIQDEEQNN